MQKKSAVVHTLDGEVEVKYLDESGNRIRANMGKASFKSSEIPVTGPEREVIDEEMIFGGKKYYATCVSVGNPHCILQVNELSKERIEKIGPFIETSSYFPNRINVHLMKVLDRKNLQIEIYERGAGYTLSSGHQRMRGGRGSLPAGPCGYQGKCPYAGRQHGCGDRGQRGYLPDRRCGENRTVDLGILNRNSAMKNRRSAPDIFHGGFFVHMLLASQNAVRYNGKKSTRMCAQVINLTVGDSKTDTSMFLKRRISLWIWKRY